MLEEINILCYNEHTVIKVTRKMREFPLQWKTKDERVPALVED